MTEKEALQRMVDYLGEGIAVLATNKLVPELPTLEDIAGPYRSSVRHLGFGCFKGETPNGSFTFDGGGAMYRVTKDDGSYAWSWSTVSASPAVYADLGIDLDKIKEELAAIA